MNVILAVLLVAGMAVVVAKQLGLLPEPRSSSYWRERAENAESALATVEEERDDLLATRTMEPILQMLGPTLELVKHVSETQQATLEKLEHFNGSLKAVQRGLEEATEGMKLMSGLIASLHELPLNPPR